MLEDAVNYPRESEDVWKTVAIGAVLSLLSVLIVPGILVAGYLQRVLRATMNDDDVPVFDEWSDLLVDGVKAVVVLLVYALVPAIIVGFSIASVAGAAFGDGGVLSGALALGALLGVLVGLLVGLALWYVVPAALANLASTGRIGSAFAFGELRPTLFSRDYAVAWLMALGVFVVAGVVAGAVSVVPLGFIVALPVEFYAAVVAFHLYGRGVADSGNLIEGPDNTAGQVAI